MTKRHLVRALLLSAGLYLCGAPATAQERPAASNGEVARTTEAAQEAMERSEEEGPVIENWWSWDYGPGKTHKHPPFGFAAINFLVFLFVLYRLAGGSFREFLHNRHHQVRKALDEARETQEKAQKQLARYEKRIAGLDAELEQLIRDVRTQAEAERARIVAAAQAQAEQLHKDALSQVRQEIERARHELERATALAALAAAEALLRDKVQDSDQKRLVDTYVASVESLAQPASSTTPGKRLPS